jgi:predicted nucleic acid-binding protein
MTLASLEAAVPAGARLLLDTSTVLAYLHGAEHASPAATTIIDTFIRERRNPASLSTMTVAETLTRPFARNVEAVAMVEAFLRHFPNLELVSVDYDVAREAARLRAATGLPTPDALIIATAQVIEAEVIVTNDTDWARALTTVGSTIQLCELRDHAPS